jgi:hypothetical protein
VAILPCFICFEPLPPINIEKDDVSDGPAEGTVFISYGNYGSTLFDPMSEHTLLRINVCDKCLKVRARDNLVLIDHITKRAAIHEFEFWNPEDDEEI